VGICVVRDSEIVETRSWLVQPEDNAYAYWNIQVHGIRPEDTATAPSFPDVWEEIAREYLEEFDTFVAHNAPFDRSCLERTAETAPLFDLIERAERWLQTHTHTTPLYKWDTVRWGEIPADYGRKG